VSTPARAPEGKRSRDQRGLRFTREGRLFVLITLGVGAAAVNTGNNLLYLVLGLMLSLIILSGVLSDLVLWWVRVRRSLPGRVFAKSPCVIELALSNQKRWLPSFSIEVEDQAAGEPTDRRCYFLKVGARAEQTAAYRRIPSRRGVMVLERFRLSTRYPFGLFEKWRMIEDRAELLVFPALVPAHTAQPRPSAAGDDHVSPRSGHGPEPSGLREYREGDEVRAIHWRRTASLGKLVVREREREVGARLSIVLENGALDPTSSDPAAREAWAVAFETAVSRAASIADRAIRHGAAVDVIARGSVSPIVLPGAPVDPILRYLALIELVDRATAPLPVPRHTTELVVPEPLTSAGAGSEKREAS
jgi:uncharacterized protein (DUF58 family)